MSLYTANQKKAVIARACEAVTARVNKGGPEVAGETFGTGKTAQTFNLSAGGWCNRFVRQVFETALGIAPFDWHFGALKAYQTLAKLKPYKVPIKDRQSGDILGCPTPKVGDSEHIAIYLGKGNPYDPAKELVAENTISDERGFPRAAGTKVSSWADFAAQHGTVTAYRLFPTVMP